MSLPSSSLTKIIEEYIAQLLDENEEGEVSLRRKDLAERFGCVPSQINYVLRSRFAPENGFLVESQRGGHGYIKVIQLTFNNCDEEVVHLADLVGNAITEAPGKSAEQRRHIPKGTPYHRGSAEKSGGKRKVALRCLALQTGSHESRAAEKNTYEPCARMR